MEPRETPDEGSVASMWARLYHDAESECAALRARAERAEADAARLREVFRRIDWKWRDEMGVTYCWVCDEDERDGHATDCAFAAALQGEPPRTVAGQVTGKNADATAPAGTDLLKPDPSDAAEVVAAFFAERSR